MNMLSTKITGGYKIIVENYSEILYKNAEKVHTIEMGIERIKRNLNLDTQDVVEWCKNKILDKYKNDILSNLVSIRKSIELCRDSYKKQGIPYYISSELIKIWFIESECIFI